ncbi:uracil-DNA glycosylase family protein [Sphingomonas sp.]|uniref:uracil-DNA glycosylase family protein n=1 Tax=Sphingomonas sp. TaxID=28214 RepID=UPI003B00BB78
MTALLDDPAERARRLTLLTRARLAALEPVRAPLIEAGRRVPHFDPLDGGADARLLLLLETPGPRATEPAFVSRDNRTGTGANLRRFLDGAEIARVDTLIWNAVPWIVHATGARNRAVTRAELREGVALLPALLALLPRLQVVVLAGAPARAAAETVRAARRDVPVLTMPHPSPTIVCTSPAIPARIADTLAAASRILASATDLDNSNQVG